MAGGTPGWRTVDEFVRARLGALGPGQRGLVFVFDPELLLRWPEDGGASLTDATGGEWRLLAYRGNDMALRARLTVGRPTVVWVRPAPLEGPESIDLTTLADLVGLADAFVDASLTGMLTSLLPSVPVPPEIGAWAPQASDDPPGFARAIERVLDFRGRPISRRHVLAAAVCQTSTHTVPSLAWLDDSDLPALVASYVHLLSVDRSERFRLAAGAAFDHVASLLGPHTATPQPGSIAGLLAKVAPEALVDHLYAVTAARRHSTADPTGALVNHGLAAPDVATLLAQEPALSPAFVAIADRINANDEALRAMAQDAERRIGAPRLRQIQGLLRRSGRSWYGEPVAAVRLALLATVVEDDDSLVAADSTDAFCREVAPSVGAPRFIRAAEALQRVACTVARYERLGGKSPVPATLDLSGLVATYVDGFATVEHDVVQARRGLEVLSSVLGEQKKLAARLEAVARDGEESLRAYDRRLAQLLRVDPGLLESSPRALHRWLPRRVGPRLQLEPDRRVWLLVFDGLRWDLWERVLRPELEDAGWEVSVEPGLAPLPTETSICRRALLGGRTPASWGGHGGMPDEESLACAFFKKWAGEDREPAYRLKAEEGGDGAARAPGTSQINVWIYQTPDRHTHLSAGILRDVVTPFRALLRENVLPELRAEITPGDLVFIGSDHGFTRVSGDRRHTVSLPKERVEERFLHLEPGDDTADLPGLEVAHAGLGRWWVATGDTVLAPVGGNVPSSSFRHGGATLREMVVPLAELRLPVRPAGALEIELRGPTQIEEETSGQYVVLLKNGSGDQLRGQLLFETALGQVTRMPLVLAPGAEAERKCTVAGREGLEWIRVRLVSGTVTLAARMLTVAVNLRPGIRLTGLEKLDDDL